MIVRILLLLFFFIFSNSDLHAEKFTITDIKVYGNVYIDSEMIILNSGLERGSEIDSEDLKDVIRRLDSLDLFNDIEIVRDDSELLLYIKENKFINEIIFKGNAKVDKKTLNKEIGTIDAYSKHKIANIINKIEAIYLKKGHLNIYITHEIEAVDGDPQRVNVIFHINEGKRARIRKLSIIGNDNFGAKQLKHVIQSREYAFYSLFNQATIFSEDILLYDQELLRIFYMNNGYYNFKVNNVFIESNADKSSFFITYDIDEGEQFLVGDVILDKKLKEVDGFEELVLIKSGQVFNQNLVDRNVLELIEFLNEKGFALADIKTDFDLDEEKRKVSVKLNFTESEIMQIREINISGNSLTKDHVIRRRLEIEESDQYNKKKLIRSRHVLSNLGIFENVDIYNKYDGMNLDLHVDVKEAQTTSLNVGGGYDTLQGIIGYLNISESNFRGLGQKVSLDLNKNVADFDVDLSFHEPHIITEKFSGGLNLFSYNRGKGKNKHNVLFTRHTNGYSSHLGYKINQNIGLRINHGFKINNIDDVSAKASRLIRDQEGKYSVHSVGYGVRYMDLDNGYYPTNGVNIGFNQQIAIPGGDARFVRNDLSSYLYKNLGYGIVWQTVAKAGYIFGYNDKGVRIDERYLIGSNEIRGFDFQGIGPRDALTKDALGGEKYVLLKLQLEKGLPFLKTMDFKASIFIDSATLWGVKDLTTVSSTNIVSNNSLIRIAGGLGLSWMTPFGSMRVDYAFPVRYSNFDERKRFRFIVGGEF